MGFKFLLKLKYFFLKYKLEIKFIFINLITYVLNVLFIKLFFNESIWLATMLNTVIIWASFFPILFIFIPRYYKKKIKISCFIIYIFCLLLNYLLYLFRNQVFRIYCDEYIDVNTLRVYNKYSSVIILYGPLKKIIYDQCYKKKVFVHHFNYKFNIDKFLFKFNQNSLQNLSGIMAYYICISEQQLTKNDIVKYKIIRLSRLKEY